MLQYIIIYVMQLCLLFSVVATYRKYDLDQESMKLYGISFEEVLEEFKRSPEYLQILMARITAWKETADNIFEIINESERIKFIEEIEQMYSEKSSARLRSRLSLREGLNSSKALHPNFINLTGIDLLEHNNYAQLITAKEKTKIVNLAYEHIGKTIHSYITNIAPDGESVETTPLSSTMQVTESKESTTEHNHKVTSVEVISSDSENSAELNATSTTVTESLSSTLHDN